MSEDTTAKRAGRRRRTTRGGRRRSLRAPGMHGGDSWRVGSDAPLDGEGNSVDGDAELELEGDGDGEAEFEAAATDEFGAMEIELGEGDGIDDTGKTAEMHVHFPAPPVADDEKTQPRFRMQDRFESFDSDHFEQRDSDADELTNPRIRVAGLGLPFEEPEEEAVNPGRSSVVIAQSRIIGVDDAAVVASEPPVIRRSSIPPRDSLPAGVSSSSSRPPPRFDPLSSVAAPPSVPAPPSASTTQGVNTTPEPVLAVPPPPSVFALPRTPSDESVSALGIGAPGAIEADDAELVDVEEAEPAIERRELLRSPPPPPPPAERHRVHPPAPPSTAVQPPQVPAVPVVASAAVPTIQGVPAVPAIPAVPAAPAIPAVPAAPATAAAATAAAAAPAKRPPPPPSAAKLEEDRQKRKQVRQWWERFFSDDYLVTVLPPTQAQIARQVDFVESSLALPKGGSVLDVGCGLGLHAIELARRGYLVVALDLSLAMITRAAEAAQEQNLKVSFIHADIREMEFDGAFDAVISLGTTFGFFDDDANRDVLARMQHGLKPGGRLLVDVVNRDYVIKSQPNLVWFEGDECVCMEESEFNYFNSRLTVKRTMMREDGRQTNAEYSMRLYSLHELGQLVQTMGFRVIEVSGQEAVRGTFFGSYAPRILMLAERRAAGPRPPGMMTTERGSAEMVRPSFAMPSLDRAGESPTRPSAAFPAADPTKLPKPE